MVTRRDVIKSPALLAAERLRLAQHRPLARDPDEAIERYVPPNLAPKAAQPKHGSGISPWHMWGNTQTLDFSGGGGFGLPTTGTPVSGQLARVEYKRPDTWHWVFQSILLDAPPVPIPGANVAIFVYFDLTIGIGRSVIQIPAFETHTYAYNNPDDPPLNQPLTTTTVAGNRRLDSAGLGPATDPTVISEFVAQDIQLSTRVALTATAPGPFTGRAIVSAQLAPKTHIRPEWHLHMFPGAEER